MTLPAGDQVGPYTITALLGSGGMGEVYRARDATLGRDVAIKVLRPAVAHDADRRARFEREARLLAQLSHSAIAHIYGWVETGDRCALVMELVEGDDLSQVAGRGSLTVPVVIAIAHQLVDALEVAHDRGIVHRDLKPSNLKRRPDGAIKVLDFGLAKAVTGDASSLGGASTIDAATQPGLVLGTAAYMAPEQARGETADARVDIWAFGCVVFELLTGERLFQGTSWSETIAAVLTRNPDWSRLPAGTPEPLRRLLDRCVARELPDRLRHIADARFDLREAAAPSREAGAPSRSRWRAAAVAAMAIAALAVGVAAMLWGRPSAATSPSPVFTRISFGRGPTFGARFAHEGRSVVFAGAFGGDAVRVFETQIGQPNPRRLDVGVANLWAISREDELALALNPSFPLNFFQPGTLARVPLAGGIPHELVGPVLSADWTPDGRELVVVRAIRSQSRVEWPLGKTILERPAAISWLRVSPRGDRAAFIETANNTATIVVVDRSGQRTVVSEQWVVTTTGLAWSPDGSEIWFTAQRAFTGGPQLYAVTPGQTPRLVLEIPGGVRLQDIGVDGRVLLAHLNNRTSLYVGDAATATEQDLSWPSGANPLLQDLSSDGARVLFTEVGSSTDQGVVLFHRAVDGSPAVRVGDGFPPFGARFSPDGRLIAAANAAGDAIRIEPVGGGEATRLTTPGTIIAVAWLPDSRGVVFGAMVDGVPRLYAQSLTGSEPRLLVETAGGPIVVSPDGRFAAWQAPGGLEIVSIAGTERRHLALKEPSGALAAWSADGRALYSYRQSDLPGAILRIDVASGTIERIRRLMPADAPDVWRVHPATLTPDARHYAYTASRAISDLYVYSGLR